MNPSTADSDVAARERRRQQVDQLCAAAIRAISGQPGLHFRAGRLHRGSTRLPDFAPHLHPALEHDDFGSFRGAADGIALRLKHNNPQIHREYAPPDPGARIIYELLEQLRVESLVAPQMPGLRRNLQHRFDAWSMAFHESRLTETATGLILYTLAQMCRARIHGGQVLPATEDLIETTRAKLIRMLSPDLAGLRNFRADQARFAPHAQAIAVTICALLDELAGQQDRDETESETRRTGPAFSLWMDFEDEDQGSVPLAQTSRSEAFEAADQRYRVFTRAYDVTCDAGSLVRAAQLTEYREHLDQLLNRHTLNFRRLARRLYALLARPEPDGWDRGQEEGRIDGARLARLIASPDERRLFISERIEPATDCAVTVLLDCSGSMKTHAEWLAMLVDFLARALEHAGVTVEILGFSTGAWHGGRAMTDWRRAGRPPQPGRLNERLHLIFKDAAQTWRRSRASIAALLKPELFREGFDGEAVDWACARLLERPEAKKLLLVVSDGCPMDGATAQANDASYLEQHLIQVVNRHESGGKVQIAGIGVGLDLSAFYSRFQAIDAQARLTHETFEQILRLIATTR